MNVPWRIETVKLAATKHFALKYMRTWGWDYHDLRDALSAPFRVDKIGTVKYEVYVRKSGEKKIITVYLCDEDTLLCISASRKGSSP